MQLASIHKWVIVAACAAAIAVLVSFEPVADVLLEGALIGGQTLAGPGHAVQTNFSGDAKGD